MASILINGQEHALPEGERLNAIQAAQRFGVDVPYYCWHPSLSVVANCRMCEIEVGQRDAKTGEIKMVPKLVPGCQTPAKEGTVLVTDSPKVREHQRMVMEYLLINHPLDCPVCDQAGQCGLQDYSYEYGQASHRFVEERLVNPKKDVSANIQLNQDRCIMCTRCVRFTREITGTAELLVLSRGSHTEIGIFPENPVDNPLAGNVVDLCPVGALLDKDFLHKQRAWYLSKHDAICTGCSTGCNIHAEENRGQIWRFRARYNPLVNDHWICDEGRYSYKAANDPDLLTAMYARGEQGLAAVPTDRALKLAGEGMAAAARAGGPIAGVLSASMTVEEAFLLASYLRSISPTAVLAMGPIPTRGEDLTFTPDAKEGRTGDVSFLVPRPFTIHAEKVPNRAGVAAVIEHFADVVIDFETLKVRAESGEFKAIYVAGGALGPSFDEADAKALRMAGFLVVQDTRATPLAQAADVVVNGSTFAEKAGSYVNATGRLQYASAILPPRDGSLPDLDVYSILLAKGVGPIRARDVLAEVAATLPGFDRAEGGKVGEFGVQVIGEAAALAAPVGYDDPWQMPRGHKGDRPGEDSPKGGKNA